MYNKAHGGTNIVTTILRLPAVKARTGLSRSTIYLRISEGRFPTSISLGDRAVGWIDSEIDEWVTKHIQSSRKPVNGGASMNTLLTNCSVEHRKTGTTDKTITVKKY